jgi:predicted nucleic acid-binding protein
LRASTRRLDVAGRVGARFSSGQRVVSWGGQILLRWIKPLLVRERVLPKEESSRRLISSAPSGTPVTDVVCDTSIVLKWFHEQGERDVSEARALLVAHRAGALTAWILDLTFYELGNVLLRSLGWAAVDVGAQLDDLRRICASLTPEPHDLRVAAELAGAHSLTFYDAVYAAVARSRQASLATADHALIDSGLGESLTVITARLGITGSL